jgi:hypothetical protein
MLEVISEGPIPATQGLPVCLTAREPACCQHCMGQETSDIASEAVEASVWLMALSERSPMLPPATNGTHAPAES